jgi:hypothetical protein
MRLLPFRRVSQSDGPTASRLAAAELLRVRQPLGSLSPVSGYSRSRDTTLTSEVRSNALGEQPPDLRPRALGGYALRGHFPPSARASDPVLVRSTCSAPKEKGRLSAPLFLEGERRWRRFWRCHPSLVVHGQTLSAVEQSSTTPCVVHCLPAVQLASRPPAGTTPQAVASAA